MDDFKFVTKQIAKLVKGVDWSKPLDRDLHDYLCHVLEQADDGVDERMEYLGRLRRLSDRQATVEHGSDEDNELTAKRTAIVFGKICMTSTKILFRDIARACMVGQTTPEELKACLDMEPVEPKSVKVPQMLQTRSGIIQFVSACYGSQNPKEG